jgi:hypothetical protein
LVSIEEIQAAYYMVAATGVLVAAVYYIMNLRVNERNRKTQLSMSIAEKLNSKEFLKNMMDVYNLSWTDLDDYLKKYDSIVNPESYVLRNHVWFTYDNLGYLLQKGLVETEIVYNATGGNSITIWDHYTPVIDYYRRVELGSNFLRGFEYLAKQMYGYALAHGYFSLDSVRTDGAKVIKNPDAFK